MKFYLVGGAVRDKLLNRPVEERDWVVIGATPEDMAARGFRAVGKEFPVFLHPDTHEEYALARTERKSGHGYHGFVFNTDPSVTLEEDLLRRDLTINAMAETADGDLIDPYHGHQDLNNHLLRHVSPAFAEDPLRVLRVARFAARFHSLEFRVADETLELMTHMTASGELDTLVPERVWQELIKALSDNSPQVFFEVLRACGALAVLFPEIERLFGVPQTAKYHPEVDTGVHLLLVMEQAAKLTASPVIRFAALTHDLGKGTTPKEDWPSHHGHEQRSVELVDQLCQRLRAPNEYRQLAELVAKYHGYCHRAAELRPGTLLKVLEGVDAFRKPQRFADFLIACEADYRGRTGYEQREYPQATLLRDAYQVTADVQAQPFLEQGQQGQAIAESIHNERLVRLTELLAQSEIPD